MTHTHYSACGTTLGWVHDGIGQYLCSPALVSLWVVLAVLLKGVLLRLLLLGLLLLKKVHYASLDTVILGELHARSRHANLDAPMQEKYKSW